jgi:hypothetical protein
LLRTSYLHNRADLCPCLSLLERGFLFSGYQSIGGLLEVNTSHSYQKHQHMMRNRGGSMNKSEIGEAWVVIWKHPSISLSVVLPGVFLLERCVVSMAVVTSTVLNPSCSISVFLWLAWLFGTSWFQFGIGFNTLQSLS